MVLAEDENGYPIINAKTELKKRNVRSFPSGQVHALVDIKVNATIPKSTRHDFKLSPSTEVYGTVLDVDGKPVSNALLLGLTKNTHPVDMNSHIFMLRGVNTGTKHLLIVLHMTKNHGVAFEVTGDKQKKIKTQLQELGSLEGQLIDEDGKPVVGRDVVAFVDIPDEKYVNVPLELFNNMGFSGLYPSAWKDTTGRQARTDKQGKFKLTGILPGLEYRLTVGKDVTSFRAPLQPLRGTYTVKPGKAKDVGKIKFIESPIK